MASERFLEREREEGRCENERVGREIGGGGDLVVNARNGTLNWVLELYDIEVVMDN